MNLIRPWLYLGKYRDTLDGSLLEASGVGAMLLLSEDVSQPGIISLYLGVEDGVPLASDLLKEGLDFVAQQKRAGRAVLIACGAGQSRSAVFGIAALKEDEGLTLMEALRTVVNAHPDAEPHKALWESLCRHYGEEIPYFDMLKALG
jgi:protein-tyrosine phosphatase